MSDISDVIGDVDLTTIEPSGGSFEPLPAGWYTVEIGNAEVTDTKAGNGKVLKIDLDVVQADYSGRRLFVRINLVNPNPKAVEIGMREMSALGAALGLVRISDTTELMGKMLQVRAVIKTEEGREPSNEVRGFRAISETAPSKPAAAVKHTATTAEKPATTTTATKPAAAKRPWEK